MNLLSKTARNFQKRVQKRGVLNFVVPPQIYRKSVEKSWFGLGVCVQHFSSNKQDVEGLEKGEGESGKEDLKFYEQRKKEIEFHRKLEEKYNLVGREGSLYCAKVEKSGRIEEVVKKWEGELSSGERRKEELVCLVGRILSKRQSSKKLVFYTIVQESGEAETIQIISSESNYLNELPQEVGSFKYVNDLLKKGDIISVKGYVGKSNKGELSVIAQKLSLLTPTFHDIPRKLLDAELRHRSRHLDLLIHPNVVKTFHTRAKVISYLR